MIETTKVPKCVILRKKCQDTAELTNFVSCFRQNALRYQLRTEHLSLINRYPMKGHLLKAKL